MSDPTHDPQQDYIASLEAELGREKKRVEVYRIAGEQAIAQVDELRAQLTAMTAERDEQGNLKAKVNAERETAWRVIDKLQQQLTASQEKLKDSDISLRQYDRRNQQLVDELKLRERDLSASEARVKRVESDIKFLLNFDAAKTIETLKARVKELEEALKKLLSQFTNPIYESNTHQNLLVSNASIRLALQALTQAPHKEATS